MKIHRGIIAHRSQTFVVLLLKSGVPTWTIGAVYHGRPRAMLCSLLHVNQISRALSKERSTSGIDILCPGRGHSSEGGIGEPANQELRLGNLQD